MEFDELLEKNTDETLYRKDNLIYKFKGEKCHRADAFSEALNQATAQELGIPVARIIEVCKIDDEWAIVSDYIKGKTLIDVINDNPEKAEELMKKFVELQVFIINKESVRYSGQASKIHYGIENSKLTAIQKFNLHRRTLNFQKFHNICHGNYTPSNVLVDENNNFYVLNWSYTTQGNPLLDLASSYLLIRYKLNREDLADLYLKYIAELSNYSKEDVLSLLPLTELLVVTNLNNDSAIQLIVKQLFDDRGNSDER